MSYKYQTITQKEIPKYEDAVMEFFGSFRYPDDYSKAVNNSAFICVCWADEKIVGAGRVVSDLSRFGFIVDLNVKKDHQNKGIGKKLTKNMVQACLDANVRYIELSTNPNFDWLEDFYKKVGFNKVTDSALMEWPRR